MPDHSLWNKILDFIQRPSTVTGAFFLAAGVIVSVPVEWSTALGVEAAHEIARPWAFLVILVLGFLFLLIGASSARNAWSKRRKKKGRERLERQRLAAIKSAVLSELPRSVELPLVEATLHRLSTIGFPANSVDVDSLHDLGAITRQGYWRDNKPVYKVNSVAREALERHYADKEATLLERYKSLRRS